MCLSKKLRAILVTRLIEEYSTLRHTSPVPWPFTADVFCHSLLIVLQQLTKPNNVFEAIYLEPADEQKKQENVFVLATVLLHVDVTLLSNGTVRQMVMNYKNLISQHSTRARLFRALLMLEITPVIFIDG